MRWTTQQLHEYLQRQNKAGSEPSSAEPEPAVCHDALAEAQGEKGNSGRVQVRITSYRRRLLDADNLAGGCKYFVDCCRYAKLIPDDNPQAVDLIFRQEKVKDKTAERTEIEVTPL